MSTIVLKILNSQFFANLILLITVLVAIQTYRSDVKQKKLTNTLEFINSFLEGNWVNQRDRQAWNDFFTSRLVRNSCGAFSLTGEFYSSLDKYNRPEKPCNVIEIFSEGENHHFGCAIMNILNLLEFIASKVNAGELDYDLVKMRLLRFYQLADFYNDILQNSIITTQIYFSEINKLFQRLSKTFGKNEPFAECCLFTID